MGSTLYRAGEEGTVERIDAETAGDILRLCGAAGRYTPFTMSPPTVIAGVSFVLLADDSSVPREPVSSWWER